MGLGLQPRIWLWNLCECLQYSLAASQVGGRAFQTHHIQFDALALARHFAVTGTVM